MVSWLNLTLTLYILGRRQVVYSVVWVSVVVNGGEKASDPLPVHLAAVGSFACCFLGSCTNHLYTVQWC